MQLKQSAFTAQLLISFINNPLFSAVNISRIYHELSKGLGTYNFIFIIHIWVRKENETLSLETKDVPDLYTENYRTLLRETTGDTQNEEIIHYMNWKIHY